MYKIARRIAAGIIYIATWYAMSWSLVKQTEIGTSWVRGVTVTKKPINIRYRQKCAIVSQMHLSNTFKIELVCLKQELFKTHLIVLICCSITKYASVQNAQV